MYDNDAHRNTDSAARMWAVVAFVTLTFLFLLFSMIVAWMLGGASWARGCAIAIGVMAVLGMLYGGAYSIMQLFVRYGLGIAQSNADLLHAHAMSLAQQAKATTEVIRGANAINKADADVQRDMLRNQASIGAHYEKRLAELVVRAQQAEARAMIAEAEPDDTPQYAIPMTGEQTTVYRLPEVR